VTRADIEVAVKFVGKPVKFLSMEQLLILTPQIRKHRIAQLQRAVESGSYRVSTEQIAAKMLQQALLDRLL
jgi:anti-sigma28 factor (negative regulator of flagellin synthesis)